MPPTSFDSDLAVRTAHAINRLGQDGFYDRLLDILALVAPHDLAALVRYSRRAPPDFVLPVVEPTAAMDAYLRHFYQLDPFHAHWSRGGETGVFRLRAMDPSLGRRRYAREFLTAMRIHDEVAVFLPAIGDVSPTLLLDRASGPFTDAEVVRVRSLWPLLAALHQRHIDLFVASGAAGPSALGGARPLRLTDRTGATAFATPAWAAMMAAAPPDLVAALAAMEMRGPCILRLPDGRLLRRTRLAAEFGPAPGGSCDEVTGEAMGEAPVAAAPLGYGGPRPAQGPSQRLPADLAARLTPREAEVTLLTLGGYPTLEIARRLGLSRGTVKNHRIAIYRKLDITTERELFGEYLAALGREGSLPS